MAWLSQQSRHSHSPPPRLRYVFAPPKLRRYRTRLRLSWALGLLVVIIIVFWPSRQPKTKEQPPLAHRVTHKPSRTRPERFPNRLDKNIAAAPEKPVKRPQQTHIFRQDGLLEVNPNAPHPILELIQRAETQWKNKAKRQSRTLKEAVNEYTKRYGRMPPKGFEIWWDYVQFHSVQLPDEYNSINERLEPFWAISPDHLIESQRLWESESDTFTIGKTPGSTEVALLTDTMNGRASGHARVRDQLEVLGDVAEWLPPFRATFSMHDGPRQFASWKLQTQAKEAAAKEQYIEPHIVASKIPEKGWAAACPPDSPIYNYIPPPLPSSHPLSDAHTPLYPPSTEKSFIYDHRLTMSPCIHPTHLSLIGYLAQFHYGHQYGPTPQIWPHKALPPTFSICTSPLHSDILAVAPEQWTDDVGLDPIWEDKVDARMVWRGSSTGILHQPGNEWNLSQRIRLVELATRRGGEKMVLIPQEGGKDDDPVGHGESVEWSKLSAAYMDVGFVGKPIQCREPVCQTLQKMFEWRKYMSWNEAWQYKYVMDIDGNGWSARFKRLMTSNSLILKSTMFPEWYTERIMPWVHYVPVQVNLSDLHDILAFFVGDLRGQGGHDDLAAKIARQGKEWSQRFWRKEDMTAYMFRLYLEYARIMSTDREAMTYKEEDSLDDTALEFEDW